MSILCSYGAEVAEHDASTDVVHVVLPQCLCRRLDVDVRIVLEDVTRPQINPINANCDIQLVCAQG